MYHIMISVSAAVLLAASIQALSLGMRPIPMQKCTPLELRACSQLGYNKTQIVPQMYLSTRRSEVFEYFGMLSLTKCSKDLLFFICMMYQPICFDDYNERILPCRSVCESVRGSCLETITKFGFKWPEELNCKTLPTHSTAVCIKPSAIIKNQVDSEVELKSSSENSVELPTSSCPACRKSKRLTRFKYYKKADYAIKAVLMDRSTAADGQTRMTFETMTFFKRGSIIKKGISIIDIWSKTACPCPQLKYNQVYFILGREDTKQGKLLLDGRTIAQPYSVALENKMKKYSTKYEAVLLKRKARKQKIFNWMLTTKERMNKMP